MLLTIDEFNEYLSQGREIEFSFNKINYFLWPDYEKNTHFYVSVEMLGDKGDWSEIFHGKKEDFFEFKFEGKYRCKEYFDKINFRYIL